MSLKGFDETFKKIEFINNQITKYETELNKYRKSKMFEIDSDIIELYYDEVKKHNETGLDDFKELFIIPISDGSSNNNGTKFDEKYNDKKDKKIEQDLKNILEDFKEFNNNVIKKRDENITKFMNELKKLNYEIEYKRLDLQIYTKIENIYYHFKLVNNLVNIPNIPEDIQSEILAYIQIFLNNMQKAMEVMQEAMRDKIKVMQEAMRDKIQTMQAAMQKDMRDKIQAMEAAMEEDMRDKIQAMEAAMEEDMRDKIQDMQAAMEDKIHAMKDKILSMKEAMEDKLQAMEAAMEDKIRDMEGMQNDIQIIKRNLQKTKYRPDDMQYIQKIIIKYLKYLIKNINDLKKQKKDSETKLKAENNNYTKFISTFLGLENKLLNFKKVIDIKQKSGELNEDLISEYKSTLEGIIKEINSNNTEIKIQVIKGDINRDIQEKEKDIKSLENSLIKFNDSINKIEIDDKLKYENLVKTIKKIKQNDLLKINKNANEREKKRANELQEKNNEIKEKIIEKIIENIIEINKKLKNIYTNKKFEETSLLNLFTINDELGFRKLIYEILDKDTINNLNEQKVQGQQEEEQQGGFLGSEENFDKILQNITYTDNTKYLFLDPKPVIDSSISNQLKSTGNLK